MLRQAQHDVLVNHQFPFQRTFLRTEAGEVAYINQPYPDVPHQEVGTPDYSDLPLTEYLSVIEVLNPMHRLWSDGTEFRWTKEGAVATA